jgi:hypothetical protein
MAAVRLIASAASYPNLRVYHFSPPYNLSQQPKAGILRAEGKLLHLLGNRALVRIFPPYLARQPASRLSLTI